MTLNFSENGLDMPHKYELKDLIGEGTFSKVYRGWERGSTCVYALKVINKRHSKLQSSENLYEKEIRILQNCKPHPNIIRLHEVLRGETHVCMVMELAAGGDLFSRLKSESHFSEEQSMSTVKMILSGVMHLHNNGITHRDLKLENILYKTDTPDSVIVISDFGLAHQRKVSNIEFSGCNCKNSSNCGSCSCNFFAMSGDCGMSTTCGTAEYFSPEMLDGEIYTGKVDLWAVGVVTYAMLCGKMPFSNEDGGGMGRVRMYQRIKMADYSLEDEVREALHIVANRPYFGGTLHIFYAKFPTVPIFLDCVPIFLKKKRCYFVPKFSNFDHYFYLLT